ncbi:hypothetical protein Tco_1067227 [Tanacetum coccineum]|uniref:Uncharacterized protein n=1 Tax=Tanacetum coccineum TaxID=301880 RepID=A0ABQ5HCW5_9ASTR
MSTSKIYQQSLADAGSKTRPPMLKRDSYIPWASRFRRYLNRKRDNRKWLLKALNEGPYVFKNFIPGGSTIPRFQTIKDLDGEDLSLHDVEMEQDDVHNNSEDPLVSAMLLLAKAITQNFSNPTNNRLRASSNTRNQAIIQGDRVNIQSRNSGNNSTVQLSYNCSEKDINARNCPKAKGSDSKYFMEEMLLAKQEEAGVILTDEQNDFLFADASRMEEIEELSANICLMARIPPADHTFR